MPRVLITGTNGLVGRELVKTFAAHGWQVVGTSGSDNKVIGVDFTFVKNDITNAQTTLDLIESQSPDLIIHSAAISTPDVCEQNPALAHQINVAATQTISNACKAHSIPLVFISTDFVFDGSAGPYTETDTPNPISVYGQTKWLAEQVVTQTAPLHCIVRTVLVYGDTRGLNRTNFVTRVRDSLTNNQPINIVNDQYRTPTFAPNLAQGILAAATRMLFAQQSSLYHLSGPLPLISVYQMAQAIAAHYNLNGTLLMPITSASLNQPAKRPPVTGFNITKAAKELNYNPIAFTQGLVELDKLMES